MGWMGKLDCGHKPGIVGSACRYCREVGSVHRTGANGEYICEACCRIRQRVYAEILERAKGRALLEPHLPLLREALEMVRDA